MLQLRDIMSTDVVTLSPEMSLHDAIEQFAANHVTGAPVLSGKRVVGVLSTSDIMDFLSAMPGVPTEQPEPEEVGEASSETTTVWRDDEPVSAFFVDLWSNAGADVDERMRSVLGPEWNALEEHVVAEAMNMSVIALPPDESVDHAAEFMRSAEVHRVLVLEDGVLLGVVSAKDISNAVADYGIGSNR